MFRWGKMGLKGSKGHKKWSKWVKRGQIGVYRDKKGSNRVFLARTGTYWHEEEEEKKKIETEENDGKGKKNTLDKEALCERLI